MTAAHPDTICPRCDGVVQSLRKDRDELRAENERLRNMDTYHQEEEIALLRARVAELEDSRDDCLRCDRLEGMVATLRGFLIDEGHLLGTWARCAREGVDVTKGLCHRCDLVDDTAAAAQAHDEKIRREQIEVDAKIVEAAAGLPETHAEVAAAIRRQEDTK